MNTWVVPVKVKNFDVVDYIQNNNGFVWKRKKTFQKDDLAYIYIASPIQEIRFLCKVVDDKVDIGDVEKNHAYAFNKDVPRYARFELIDTYPAGLLPWADIHAHGMGQALLPTKVYSDLSNWISSKV